MSLKSKACRTAPKLPMALSLVDGRLALTALINRHANSMCISLPAADAEPVFSIPRPFR